MKFYCAGRGSGKTTRLIIESFETGAVIVCPHRKMADYVYSQALLMSKNIEHPISNDEFIRRLRYSCQPKNGYLIDELGMVMDHLGVKACTMCMDEVYSINHSDDKINIKKEKEK